MDKKTKRWLSCLIFIVVLVASGWLVPEPRYMPVDGATVADWHPQSFWYEPWGSSGVHKGIDIFAGTDTPVIATTHLVVLFSGNLHKGGKVVLGVGPKWRLHYFAHLNHIDTNLGLVKAGQPIGRVGDSGNAAGKPPHLHYSIVSLLPRPWLVDFSTQGYKKAFFLDPGRYITADLTSD